MLITVGFTQGSDVQFDRDGLSSSVVGQRLLPQLVYDHSSSVTKHKTGLLLSVEQIV